MTEQTIHTVASPSDLIIDDNLPLLERVLRYSLSKIALQRLVHVRLIGDAIRESKESGMQKDGLCLNAARIVSRELVPSLMTDEELAVRQALALQLKEVAVICLDRSGFDGDESDEARKFVLTELVPYLGTMFTSPDVDVRRASSEAISDLAHHLTHDEVKTFLLPFPSKVLAQNSTKTEQQSEQEQLPTIPSTRQEVISEDLQTFAVVLLGTLCANLSREQVMEEIMPKIMNASNMNSLSAKIRSACVIAIPRGFNNIPSIENDHGDSNDTFINARSKALQSFHDLARDPSVACRKICAESLEMFSPNITICCNESLRIREKLLEILLLLLRDENKFVSTAALHRIGPCVASICSSLDDKRFQDISLATKNLIVKDILPYMRALSGQARDTSGATSNDNLAAFCAYNLPGIIYCMGGNYWKDIRDIFLDLLYTKQSNNSTDRFSSEGNTFSKSIMCKSTSIRKILSHSLYEVSKIVGPDLTSRDLFQIFKDFLTLEEDDTVFTGVLKNLADFIQLLNARERIEMLSLLPNICRTSRFDLYNSSNTSSIYANSRNWRLRQLMAQQLGVILNKEFHFMLHEDFENLKLMLLVSFNLLRDSVASVREVAAKELIPVILISLYFEHDEPDGEMTDENKSDSDQPNFNKRDLFEFCIKHLRELALNENFVHRQSFCLVVVSLLNLDAKLKDTSATTRNETEEFHKLLSTNPESIFSLFVNAERDPVSNVRSSLFRSLQALIQDTSKSSEICTSGNSKDTSHLDQILMDMTNRLRVEEEGWWR